MEKVTGYDLRQGSVEQETTLCIEFTRQNNPWKQAKCAPIGCYGSNWCNFVSLSKVKCYDSAISRAYTWYA
jgi:hypothetical protein